MFKRALVLFLSLVMLLSVGNVTAFAAGEEKIVARGIDVSSWQGDDIDWEKVKSDGASFVIIRIGFNGKIESKFEQNYEGARAAGLNIGGYFYSTATTTEKAEQDADLVMEVIKDKTFEYPIYYDVEDSSLLGSLTNKDRTDIALAFTNKLQENGYYAGVYTNAYWLNNYLETERLIQNTEIWVAHYVTEELKDYSQYGLYQYTDAGEINGIYGNVDKNVAYKDYPTIIEQSGYNGFPLIEVDTDEPTLCFVKDKWYYVKNKRVDFTATLVFEYEGQWKFIENGVASTDIYKFIELDGKKYFLDSNSNLLKGWAEIDGKWFYFDDNGEMLTNRWMKDSKGWCYIGSKGYMLTNAWVMDSEGWCFVGSDGYCVTNTWKKDNYGWCYLDAEGRVATNSWVMDSQGWCYVDADGYCVTNTWKKDSHGWCYLDSEGRMATNRWVMDSKGWCYVGADGYCVTNQWKQDSYGWCYLDSEGSMVKNNWVYDSGWYYLDGNGYMLFNTSKKISGKVYRFNKSGLCTNP